MKEWICREMSTSTSDNENGVLMREKELIRCKDCKHCRRELAQGKWEGSCRYWNTHSVMLNDFCSYGERKEE